MTWCRCQLIIICTVHKHKVLLARLSLFLMKQFATLRAYITGRDQSCNERWHYLLSTLESTLNHNGSSQYLLIIFWNFPRNSIWNCTSQIFKIQLRWEKTVWTSGYFRWEYRINLSVLTSPVALVSLKTFIILYCLHPRAGCRGKSFPYMCNFVWLPQLARRRRQFLHANCITLTKS